MVTKSNWASWVWRENGWVRTRGTSRRWRRAIIRGKSATIYLGRRSMMTRRGCRSMCADYSDGARRTVSWVR